MTKQSLQVLFRYRKHLLEKAQIELQDKIAEENQQKLRLLTLEGRVQATHNAKAKSATVEEILSLDKAAAYLHSRMVVARRAVSLSGRSRQEAVERTLKAKQSVDQIELLMEKGLQAVRTAFTESERKALDELVTSRYAMALGGI